MSEFDWKPMAEKPPTEKIIVLWFPFDEDTGIPAGPQTAYVKMDGEIVNPEGGLGVWPYEWMEPTHWAIIPGPAVN